ncbi:MAG: hypothetical protein HOG85_04045 [Flavobacteriales bacterium]|mgnify:FL=1|jgi:hypothetical protein|nr:hypothetical protein [Flavobacteriales bacterium]MBT7481289.1 hypothetical protein [Flavobacteriales bacterium]
MKKLLILLLCFPLLFSSCRKDDVYELNEINATSYNANKNKLKSSNQFISILYANLFQEALSANELVEISRCIQSIGDKEVAHEIILSNFMNKEGVIIPSNSIMRDDLNLFIEESYKRFFVRDITEAEREFFLSFFESHPNVSAEMVYMAFSLSNEYQYY